MEYSVGKSQAGVPEFLVGGGEMGQRIREFDWSKTSLGPAALWSRSLRTCVQIMLTSRQPIWIGWGKELIKLYNDPYIAIAGGKHPRALGEPASVVWRDIWKDIEPMLRQVMVKNEGTYVEAQLLIMERNGYPEETYYTFSYTPIAGDHGKTEGMICFNTDDTERIISERQLLTLTRLGKSLTDSKTNDGVFRQTIHTLEENPHDFPFALLYELSGDHATCVNSTKLGTADKNAPHKIDLNSDNEIAALVAKAITERKYKIVNDLQSKIGVMPSGAWKVAPKNAIILPVAQRGQKDAYGFLVIGLNPYRLANEKYLDFFELIADQITTSLANVHALEEERKQLEALETIDRAKTTFFSNISHEFRTPLTLLLAPIEDLLSDPDVTGSNRERAEVAFRNAQRMQKLVNLLLDFSRIEAGRIEANFTAVDIVSLTADLASNFRSAIEKAGMQLVLNTELIEEPVYVDVDMWEKIVLNLLSNAFKYSEQGYIEVSVRRAGASVEVAVKDTGIGIPESETGKIFERFHRVQNVGGRSQEGTGIGLAMVKELVKLHKGTISVKSALGKGSVFTVCLPLGIDHLKNRNVPDQPVVTSRVRPSTYVEEALQWTSGTKQSENNGADSPGSNSTEKYRVLLADDNADMRNYIHRLLAPEYHVILAGDGETAFSKAVQYTPHLILSDIMMPKLDGFGLLKKLKSNLSTQNIPVVFLSARAGEEAKVEGLKAGADDYMTKPFSSRELLARVNNHVVTATARRQTEREFFNLFLQSPAHIHVFKGPEHVLEFFHPLGIALIGKDITGMKIREALPQLEGQGFFEMLDKVYSEGATVHSKNSKASLTNEKGETKEHYFDVTYLPWKNLEGRIQGVLQFTFEVTETVEQQLRAEANEKKFRSIAQQAPVAMAVLRGPTHVVEVANDRVLELWQKKYEEVIDRPVLEIFPEIIEQGLGEILRCVFETGEPFVAHEMPVSFVRQGGIERIFINLLYEPFRNENSEIEGIVAVGTDVTEQVLARNKVAEAELKFRTIIEQTPSPLCIFRGEELMLEVANDAALAVWQAGHDVIGRRLVEIVPEMARQPFLELMLDVYKNGVTRYGYEAPAYFLRKEGGKEERFFNFIYVPFRETDGSISGVLVLATDVTEQVCARKKLIENEERLRIATEIVELGTWEYDLTNDVIYGSEKTIDLFGFPPGTDLRLKEVMDTIVTEDKKRVEQALQWALNPASNGAYSIEYSLTNIVDKKQKTIRVYGQAFFNSENKPYRMIGTALDITERKKAEEEIKASEARFRLLATSIPQIVWTMDKEGNTNYISAQYEKFTGVNPEMSYDARLDLVHPQDRRNLVAKRSMAIQNGVGWQEEFRLKNIITGTYRWFLGNSKPLRDDAGNIIMWIGSASDVQDLKEQSSLLELQVQERTKALKELNESLKLSNEDLQQFAHVASHDLKEPIRKIKTFSNRLQDDYHHLLPEKGNIFLNKILSATNRMYSMIDGVLSYSTITAIDQPREKVDLNEVLANIQIDLEVLIQEKKVTFTIDALPTIEGAPVLLYQLLYNLVNNSIKFSKENEPPVIKIESEVVDLLGEEFGKIIITDNGIGFDQEHAGRIFTTFTRLNSKDKYEGTGLGLALCKKIVQRHGGFILAKGEKNKGAEFTVLLPIK